MIEIIPTVVPNGLEDVDALLARCRSFSQAFHIDFADGVFAPNKTWMPNPEDTFPESETIFYEAHLMVMHPEAAGLAVIAAGAKRLIAHVEAFDSIDEAKKTFDSWRIAGAKEFGVALLIETPLEAFEEYSLWANALTVMSIPRIGVQGIPFDERGYGRVADLHTRYPDFPIEVDGGVGEAQIATLTRAGATRFSVGSALAKSDDPAKTHSQLLSLAQAAV
jgi:ribulose-phosphate 3-epimerase